MTARTPPQGLEIALPELGTVRGARVGGISNENVDAFIAAVQAAAADARTVRVTADQYNSAQVELWAIAQIIANPTAYMVRANEGTTAQPLFPLRLDGTRVVQVEAAATTLPGDPIVGANLVVERLRELNPGTAGLTEAEVERRRWVLAIYETVRKTSQAAQEVERRAGRAAGQWVQLGRLAIIVGAALFALVYDSNRDAEVESQAAREHSSFLTCARLYEQRLAVWRQTGMMPPISEQERACSTLMVQRADDGWRNVSNAAADVLQRVGEAGSSSIKWVAAAAAAWFLFSKSR